MRVPPPISCTSATWRRWPSRGSRFGRATRRRARLQVERAQSPAARELGAPGGRGGARLPQPPHRHPQQRWFHRRRAPQRGTAKGPRGHRGRRAKRQRADRKVVDAGPRPTAQPGGRRGERCRDRLPAAASAGAPPGRPDHLQRRGRAATAAPRSPSAGAGVDEHGPERPRRDVGRRSSGPVDAGGGDRRGGPARARLGQGRQLRPPDRGRQRLWDVARGGRTRVRTVLHHQTPGRRNRAGTRRQLGRRAAARGIHPLRLRGRRRHHLRDLPAGGRGAALPRRQPPTNPLRQAAPRGFSSPTISPICWTSSPACCRAPATAWSPSPTAPPPSPPLPGRASISTSSTPSCR